MTVIQLALLVAVRAHPVVPVTVTDSDAPDAATLDWLAGEIENAPHAAASWLTVKVCPATVTVPVRAVPAALAATVSATVPLPVPVAPAVTVIQLALLVAVRAHPVVPVTVTDSEAPDAATLDWLAGEIENAPHAAASWVTVKVCPATVTVPVRAVPAALAATVSATVPLPVPVAPAVTVIQLALLVAVRAHPVVPVTVTDSEAPDAATLDWLAGEIENAPHAAASWVTVKVCPATVTVPVRAVPAALAATLSATVPLPVPVAPAVTVIQLALLVAVRAHPVVPVTVTDSDAPDAATLDWLAGEIENAPHAAAAWLTV